MRTYLKIVNPAVALIVLALCFWAATYEKESFALRGIVAGGMATYFFAKGLFSASAVFILGKILVEMLARRESGFPVGATRSEVLYCFGLIGLVLATLSGLLLHIEQDKGPVRSPVKLTVTNPKELEIIEHYVVADVQPLRLAGKLRNNSSFEWENVVVRATVRVHGRFAGNCRGNVGGIGPNKEGHFAAVCADFSINGARHPTKYELEIAAERKGDPETVRKQP